MFERFYWFYPARTLKCL